MKTTLAELTTGERELPLPIRLVSDWHLGHPGSRVESIAQVEYLLEGVGTFVMVGDGREELVEGWRARADELWNELQEACRSRGIVFVALTGNHDPGVSSEGWLKLFAGRILVTHGDMIYETASPWSRELFSNRQAVSDFLAERACQSLNDRWRCAQEVGRLLRPKEKMPCHFLGYLKLALWPPERLLEVGRVWAGFAKEAGKFAEVFSAESEVVICGHFHRPGEFVVGERRVWNLGSLMKMSKALALDVDEEGIRSLVVQLGE